MRNIFVAGGDGVLYKLFDMLKGYFKPVIHFIREEGEYLVSFV